MYFINYARDRDHSKMYWHHLPCNCTVPSACYNLDQILAPWDSCKGHRLVIPTRMKGTADSPTVHSNALRDAHRIDTCSCPVNYLTKHTPQRLCSMDCNYHRSGCILLQFVLNATNISTYLIVQLYY